jgi:hypothetical protein
MTKVTAGCATVRCGTVAAGLTAIAPAGSRKPNSPTAFPNAPKNEWPDLGLAMADAASPEARRIARGVEHPKVREVLDMAFDPDKSPRW